jgi:hypothetical protein
VALKVLPVSFADSEERKPRSVLVDGTRARATKLGCKP